MKDVEAIRHMRPGGWEPAPSALELRRAQRLGHVMDRDERCHELHHACRCQFDPRR